MVFLRTFISLDSSCISRFKYCNNGLINFKNHVFNLKPKNFSNSPNSFTRGKWPNKPNLESFQPQFENLAVESENLGSERLVKPFLFTLAFSTASISGAAIWQYENIRAKYGKKFDRSYKYGTWRNNVKTFWRDLNDAGQIFIPICLANILIFGAWRMPSMQAAMVKYFCSNPAARNNCWPMVFSTFSHYSTLHIFANMYVLQSFCTAATVSMGKEQFLGFYMAAGVIASFASYVYKVVANKPGLSLGASGAIMGILGYTCVTYPDLQLSILFLPFFTFKAGLAIKVIMGADLAGILLGWRFFDHAAHLGGAAFGVFWGTWGNEHIWQKRNIIIDHWKRYRNTDS